MIRDFFHFLGYCPFKGHIERFCMFHIDIFTLYLVYVCECFLLAGPQLEINKQSAGRLSRSFKFTAIKSAKTLLCR